MRRLLLGLVVVAVIVLGAPPAFAAAPNVTSFTPDSGVVGDSVVISGDGFDTTTAVSFNGTGAPFTIDSAIQLTATVPVAATTGPISVDNTDGTGVSSTDFTVLTPPSITSFSPHQGKVGTSVTLLGSNFDDVTSVDFGGTAATFDIVGATEISTQVPSGASTGAITVTSPDGADTTATEFDVIKPPHISGFSPGKGPIGTIVAVSGSYFRWVSRVWFGNQRARFNVVSDGKLKARVPKGFKDARIRVKNPAGTDKSGDVFHMRRVRISTRISFGLHKHLRAAGVVDAESGTHPCEARRLVLIQRLVSGHWKTIKQVRTGSHGGFNTAIADTSGTYRAKAVTKTTLRLKCLSDVSPTDTYVKPTGGGGGGGGGTSDCTPGYSPCLVYHGGADYDCYGGSGNGPYYTKPGQVYRVTGSDPYGLDADNDGYGCE